MALLGYLVALSILLGGGYAGLQWLASPTSEKHARHSEHVPARSAANDPGRAHVSSEADRKGTAETSAEPPSAPESVRPNRKDAQGPSGDPSRIGNTDIAPAGGCMPLGVTTKGDVVFPMRCEALIHHQADQPSSSPPASPPKPAAPSDQQAQPVQSGDSKSTRVGEVGVSEIPGASGRSGNSRSSLDSRQTRPGKQEQSPRAKSAKTISAQDADRSRERPVARSRRTARAGEEPDWYNALGLR